MTIYILYIYIHLFYYVVGNGVGNASFLSNGLSKFRGGCTMIINLVRFVRQ